MTDKPKPENENRSSEPVKRSTLTLSPCLHCAIVDIVNTWADAYAPNGIPDGSMVLIALGKIAAELIEQVEPDQRVDALGFFTVGIAKRLKLTAAAAPPPPTAPGTGTTH